MGVGVKIHAIFFENKVNQSVRSSVKWVKNQILKEDGFITKNIASDIYAKLKIIFEEIGFVEISNILEIHDDLISIDSSKINFNRIPHKNIIYQFSSDIPPDSQDDDLFNHVYNSPYTFENAPDLYDKKYGTYTGIWVPKSVYHYHNLRLDALKDIKNYHKINFDQGTFIFSLPLSLMFLNEKGAGLSPESVEALSSISMFFPKKELIGTFWG